MQSALQTGPVSVAVEADQSAFQRYSSGILSSGCGTNLDHGVLAVGLNTAEGYYLVKNSWGSSWGDSGYLKISTSGNVCGITSQPSYPTVSGAPAPPPAPVPPPPPTPPTPAPTPVPPAPTPTGTGHYMPPDADGNCKDDEILRKVADGAVMCAASCEFSDAECPTDFPAGTGRVSTVCNTLYHQCELHCGAFKKCGDGMQCYSGVCGYPSDAPVPAPVPPPPSPLPPTPPPTPMPPAPTPPAPIPGKPHYEMPPCQYDDELPASIEGFDGGSCFPPCDSATGDCPADVPEGTKATPFCALQGPDGRSFCALRCGRDSGCPTGAKCQMVQFPIGICLYPDDTYNQLATVSLKQTQVSI